MHARYNLDMRSIHAKFHCNLITDNKVMAQKGAFGDGHRQVGREKVMINNSLKLVFVKHLRTFQHSDLKQVHLDLM